MRALFLTVLDMSVTASYVIAAVLVIRLLLRRAPKKWSYLLWSVVAFRLCCPVSFQSVFSMFNLRPVTDSGMQTMENAAEIMDILPGYIGTAPQLQTIIPVTGSKIVPAAPQAINAAAPIDWLTVIMAVWFLGMAALLLFGNLGYLHTHRQMATAIVLEGNVYQSDRVRSPFILGFLRPRIYIPFHLDADTQRYVLAHEQYHIRRLDHIVKPFAFLLLTLHWFNPLCWLAFHLMSKDMEMSCDEKVLAGEDNIRKAYSASLLSFAANRRFPSPLSFSETGVKSRIQNILRWRKPKSWVTVTAGIVCAAVVAACAADPMQNVGSTVTSDQKNHTGQYTSMDDYAQVYTHSLETATYYTSGSTTATAAVTDTKIQWLDQLGEVQGLHPDGVLEVWDFMYLIQIDADAKDVMLVGGMGEKDGWYDLEGQGGYILVSLRYPDSSYDVLHIEPYNDGMNFRSYHNSWSEALVDWYIKENELDYPLYVDTFLQKNHTVHFGNRFTGPGWYFYLPVSGWELTQARTWSSSYGTGAYLAVHELEISAQEQMDLRLRDGWQSAEADMLCVKHPSDAVMEYYYDKADGGCCQVRISWNTNDWWSDSYQASELELLRAMAKSFTVDERINSGSIANLLNKLVFKTSS